MAASSDAAVREIEERPRPLVTIAQVQLVLRVAPVDENNTSFHLRVKKKQRERKNSASFTSPLRPKPHAQYITSTHKNRAAALVGVTASNGTVPT